MDITVGMSASLQSLEFCRDYSPEKTPAALKYRPLAKISIGHPVRPTVSMTEAERNAATGHSSSGKWNEKLDILSKENIKKHVQIWRDANALFEKIMSADDVEVETIRIRVLVDCYGVYASLFELFDTLKTKYDLTEKTFSLDATTELGWSLFFNLERQLTHEQARETPILSKAFEGPNRQGEICELSLRRLCMDFIKGETPKDQLCAVRKVTRIEFDYEWFFAPFPKEKICSWIESHLKKAWDARNRQSMNSLQKLLKDAESSLITIHNNQRDYSIYHDFIRKIADRLSRREAKAKLHHGTYKYFVSGKGVESFNEKQVDTLITIRAMECLYDHEANAVCIVSTDTDFLPLFGRFRKVAVPLYQSYAVPKAGGKIPKEHVGLESEGAFLPSFISYADWQNVLGSIFEVASPEIRQAIDSEVSLLVAEEEKLMHEAMLREYEEMDAYYAKLYPEYYDDVSKSD